MREVLGLRELGGDDDEAGSDLVFGDAEQDAAAADGEAGGGAAVERGWRRRAAGGVVMALFIGVGYMLTLGRPPGAGSPGIAEAPPAPAAPAGESVEEAATAALNAWARFADSGDVDQLGPAFDLAGPQYARLRAEAPVLAATPAGGAPYGFTATGIQVRPGGGDGERVVVADVVVSRPGETDQRFAWELVMRKSEGHWRLWTVRERTASGGGRPAGGS
jgi:hypothetical protein